MTIIAFLKAKKLALNEFVWTSSLSSLPKLSMVVGRALLTAKCLLVVRVLAQFRVSPFEVGEEPRNKEP